MKLEKCDEIGLTIKNNIDEMKAAQERFSDDIQEILHLHKKELNELIKKMEGTSESEQTFIIGKKLFDTFIYEKLFLYERTDNNRIGIIMSIENDYGAAFRMMKEYDFQDEFIEKIQLYFSKFSIPIFGDERDKQIQEIKKQGAENKYNKILNQIIMCSLMEGIDNWKTTQLINALLNRFYFEVTMPAEDNKIAHERYRIENDIPDFSDVYLGQEWQGKNRMAQFIKALHLRPKPAGKNSRIAQEKSILRSCAFTDDKINKKLTLLEIYEKRYPKFRKEREKKYEPYITVLLLKCLLTMENGILKTTKNNFLKTIGAIPNTYKKIPIQFYVEDMPEILVSADLPRDLQRFHEITSRRFKEIVNPALERLEEKSLIKYRTYPVVVTANSDGKEVHTSIFDSDSLGLKEGKLAKMIMKAEQYAANQIEVNIFDSQKRQIKKIKLKDVSDVMKYWKYQDYKQIYDKYITEKYGWKYTYEQLEIVLTENTELVQDIMQETEKATKKINQLLVKSIQTTIGKKVSNAEEKYQHEYEQIEQKYLAQPDIKAFWDNGIIGQEDIRKQIHLFRYNNNFLERTDYFIQHEIKQDVPTQEKVDEWMEINKR